MKIVKGVAFSRKRRKRKDEEDRKKTVKKIAENCKETCISCEYASIELVMLH